MIQRKAIRGLLFCLVALFVLNNAIGRSTLPYINAIAWSSNTLRFTDDADLQNGVTLTGGPLQVQFQPATNGVSAGWSLKVTATTPFVNGSSSIDPSHFFLTYSSVDGGPPTDAQIRAATPSSFIRLGTTGVETPLISNSPGAFPAFSFTTVHFNAKVEGGNYLYQNLSAGDYVSTMRFSWYDAQGNLVDQKSYPIDFYMQYVGTTSYGNFTVSLNDPDVTFDFNQTGAYANGLTVQKPAGLHVSESGGWDSYKIQVFTTTDNLVRDASTYIPASVVKLGIAIHTAGVTDVSVLYNNSNPLPLSATHKMIIQRPSAAALEAGVDFDLTYSIAGNDPDIYNAPAGTYTSVITYIISPP